jgi:16S rRNA (guanine527-N7)-methyltransferase
VIARADINSRPIRLPLGPTGFARVTGVSRETLERITTYVELLELWNRRINLIGRNTMGDIWRRHILDAAQLYPLLPARTRILVDLGSGAGLPGLVLALMGVPEVHLIESDQRKAVFLREACRITGIAATVHAERIEKTPQFVADVITARALTDLGELLEFASRFVGNRTLCLFPKGETADAELAAASHHWRMKVERVRSRSDPGGVILKLEALQRGLEP